MADQLTRKERRELGMALEKAYEHQYSRGLSVTWICELQELVRNLPVSDALISIHDADHALTSFGWERISPWSLGLPMHYIATGHALTICGDYLGHVKWTEHCPSHLMDGNLTELAKSAPKPAAESDDDGEPAPAEVVSAC